MGYVVFVADAAEPDLGVFVSWCPAGAVDRLVDRVRSERPGAELIDCARATPDALDRWLAGVSSERRMGRWFSRSPKFISAMPLSQEHTT